MSARLVCRCGCYRPASFLGDGKDIDGSSFADEPMCETAASYCAESAAELGLPFTLRRITAPACLSAGASGASLSPGEDE